MRFAPKLSRDFRDLIADHGDFPPRDAVGALLSFGDPDDVLTYRIPGNEASGERPGWLCVARSAGGLLIVEASSTDDGWSWADRDFHRDRDSKVAATWYPLHAVTGVALRNARAFRGNLTSDMEDIHVEGTWAIHVDGRDSPLMFKRAPGGRDVEVVEKFCVELAKAVATAR